MREFEKKRKVKKILYGRIVLILLIVVFVLISHGTFKIFQKQRMVKDDLKSTKQILVDSELRKENLKEKLERMESPVGKEELLRENYSLSKDGEKAFYVLDADEEVITEVKEKGFLGRIFSPIVNLFN